MGGTPRPLLFASEFLTERTRKLKMIPEPAIAIKIFIRTLERPFIVRCLICYFAFAQPLRNST